MGLAHHPFHQAFLFDQLTLACVDTRRQWEVAAGTALSEVQLLNSLLEIADQCEVLGARLMQADDVA